MISRIPNQPTGAVLVHRFGIVLSSNVSLEKSFEYKFLERWLGRGLLTSTGPKWRARRKLLTPSFHFRILEDFLPTFNDQSLVLVKKLQSLQHKEYVDILPPVILCTLDIVCGKFIKLIPFSFQK
ncbi:Cytochrome P450 4V2 [Araneus ventricosus]|uniref:Cytochrome P450 4V2 n=1 Tax=Araneus ventricosus TaxID=182803 RepID=A0A4Y2MZ23_ARAVE|nr:Cytochrome P450 4V2 [Araneus ventricosus]